LREHPVYAFAGIARPEQFFRSVREFGIELSGYATFPDHHAYSSKDADHLLLSAMESGAQLLITTEKDAVRLPEKLKSIVMVAEMELDFGPDDKRIAEYFDAKLKMTRP
jgi:tetraacyldisaccharide 4'-kinase